MKRAVFEVLPDQNNGWKVVNNKRSCIARTNTKREAVHVGVQRARDHAYDFGPAALRIRRANGQFQEQRLYTDPLDMI